MKNLIKIILISISLAFFHGVSVAQAQLSVIVNEKGPQVNMTTMDLKKVFKGEKQRWSDGTAIKIAMIKTNLPVGTETAKKVYNMTSDEVSKLWLGLVFSGQAKAPVFFVSESELLNFVQNTPGAIGIVSTKSGTGNRVANIDGKTTF